MEALLGKDGNEILNAIHNEWALKAGDHTFRVMECEWYAMDDVFTHKHPRQKTVGQIYVHRSGIKADSKYKGGSFQGMDITLNGGILIRAIRDGNKIIEGPCNVVRHLCSKMNWDQSQLEEELEIIPHIWTNITPYIGARVGLTLKRAPVDELEVWAKYLIQPLRSSIFVPSKHKETFFATDVNRDDIPSRVQSKYKDQFNKGKDMELCSTMTQLEIAGYFLS